MGIFFFLILYFKNSKLILYIVLGSFPFGGMQLIELESQLKLEIKARNRAEKMLKFATKKLESLNISAALGQSSSPASEGSVSSSTCSSSPQEPDGSSSSQKEIRKSNTEEKIKNEADSLLSEDFRCKNSATAGADAVNQEPCYEQGSSSADAANFHNNEGGSVEDVNEFKDSLSSRELTTDAFRYVYICPFINSGI